MARQRDPNNEQVHKVRLVQLEAYKAGVKKVVVAQCGKVWAPTFPVDVNLRTAPRCSICYPTSEQQRFGMAK